MGAPNGLGTPVIEAHEVLQSPPVLPRVVATTPRLVLRRLDAGDAEFIHALVTDPDWLRYIGDRGVHSVADAVGYIERGPVAMYDSLGLGLLAVELRDGGVPIGICGILKRPGLDDVDLGFAFLPAWRAHGYGYEAAAAVLDWARSARGLRRVVAIASPDNAASARLLGKLGFRFERTARMQADADEVSVFGIAL